MQIYKIPTDVIAIVLFFPGKNGAGWRVHGGMGVIWLRISIYMILPLCFYGTCTTLHVSKLQAKYHGTVIPAANFDPMKDVEFVRGALGKLQ